MRNIKKLFLMFLRFDVVFLNASSFIKEIFVFSLGLVLIEKIYQACTQYSVRLHFKHLEVCQKYPLHIVFSALFSVFEIVVKHGLLCLIYYLCHFLP